MSVFLLTVGILTLLVSIFFASSKKEKWEKSQSSSFECGFSSYYYSRFSFSIHYLMMGLIFLFFDLEMCFLMPFLNQETSSWILNQSMIIFVWILLTGLYLEYQSKKLNWVD